MFQYCRWDNPVARFGCLFFSIFAFSIIWFYVDKFQQAAAAKAKPASPPVVAKKAEHTVVVEEEKEALAERRAKKRDLLMKMTAPTRIDEDPLQEEHTARELQAPKEEVKAPTKKQKKLAKSEQAPKPEPKLIEVVKTSEPKPETKPVPVAAVVLVEDEWNVV